jgi:hypothetical protein
VKAGRDLDDLVAEKVMGWFLVSSPYGRELWTDYKGLVLLPDHFSPSVSITDAWQVVEAVGQEFLVRKRLNGNDYRAFIIMDKGKEIYAHAKTASLAICLAALKAKGVETHEKS